MKELIIGSILHLHCIHLETILESYRYCTSNKPCWALRGGVIAICGWILTAITRTCRWIDILLCLTENALWYGFFPFPTWPVIKDWHTQTYKHSTPLKPVISSKRWWIQFNYWMMTCGWPSLEYNSSKREDHAIITILDYRYVTPGPVITNNHAGSNREIMIRLWAMLRTRASARHQNKLEYSTSKKGPLTMSISPGRLLQASSA